MMQRTTKKRLMWAIRMYEVSQGGHAYARDSLSIQGGEEWVIRDVVLGYKSPPSGFSPDPTYWMSKTLLEHVKNHLTVRTPQIA